VTGATGPATATMIGGVTEVATQLTTANQFTKADLINLYANCENVTEGGVTYNPNGTATGSQVPIDLYIPQEGSGVRAFWASELGFSDATLPSCVRDEYSVTVNDGLIVDHMIYDNSGAALAADPYGYMPFSVAEWIGQSRGYDDQRDGAVLTDINGAAPFTGTVPDETLNAAFPINGEVYNVVEGCRVDSTAPLPYTGATCSLDPDLIDMLVGPNSSLCEDGLTIVAYGFALLPNANEPDACGSIAPSLRAFPPPV
jgi:hypothetical protein